MQAVPGAFPYLNYSSHQPLPQNTSTSSSSAFQELIKNKITSPELFKKDRCRRSLFTTVEATNERLVSNDECKVTEFHMV